MAEFSEKYDKTEPEQLILPCLCGLFDHCIRFAFFKPESTESSLADAGVYVNYHMDPSLPWYKRFLLGVQYILGIGKGKVHFGETWLQHSNVEALATFIRSYQNVWKECDKRS